MVFYLRRTGMKWDDIAKRLPGRSAQSCRRRNQNYSEKRQDWGEEKKNKLAWHYNRYVAATLQSRTSCIHDINSDNLT